MRRGEIWEYAPAVSRPGRSLLRLVVSAPAVNADPYLPMVLGVHVLDTDPGGLLAVKVGASGWASALTVEPVIRSRLKNRVDVVDQTVMEQVITALRAALEV